MTYITKAEDIKLNNEASRFTTDNLNTEVNGLFDGQTAANLLTKIKTVDGAGSGLDADLLDGAQGSDYAKLVSPTFTGTVSLPSTTSIGNVSSTELGYLDGVTSALQTQLNNKSETTHLHTDIYEPANSNIQTHIASTSNPHGVTAGQIGAEPSGSVSTHNSAIDAHSDIRSELLSLSDDVPSDPLPREADTLEGHDASYYTTYSDTAVSNHNISGTAHTDIRSQLAQIAPVLPTSTTPFVTPQPLSAEYTLRFVGCSHWNVNWPHATGNLLAVDEENNALRSSSNLWSFGADLGLPVNVSATGVEKIIGGDSGEVYMLAYDSVAERFKIYVATFGETLSWTEQLTLTAGAVGTPTAFERDASYFYVGEYGDPTGGPKLYRYSGTWTQIWTRADCRHIHDISHDCYNPGHLWMTIGDGVADCVYKSTDYGATWSVIVADAAMQAMQVSFDANYVYFATDNAYSGGGSFYVYERSTGKVIYGSPNSHRMFAVPGGGSGDLFYGNAFAGCVDKNTGAYYMIANDGSGSGNKAGLFICPKVGQPLQLLAVLSTPFNNIKEMFMFSNSPWDNVSWLIFGNWAYKQRWSVDTIV